MDSEYESYTWPPQHINTEPVDMGELFSFEPPCACNKGRRATRVEVCGPATLVANFKASLNDGAEQLSVADILEVDEPTFLACRAVGHANSSALFKRGIKGMIDGLTLRIENQVEHDIYRYVMKNSITWFQSLGRYPCGVEAATPDLETVVFEVGDELFWDKQLRHHTTFINR